MESIHSQQQVEAERAAEVSTEMKDSVPPRYTVSFDKYEDIWVGPSFIPALKALQNEFEPRPGDIFLASLPKTGTTWTKALLYTMIYASCSNNHVTVAEKNPHALVPTMEVELFNSSNPHCDISIFSKLPSPRLLHTHLPVQALPPLVRSFSDCKIVSVTRNPRDTFVSLWKFNGKLVEEGLVPGVSGEINMETAFDAFCSGFLIHGGPFAENVLSYWRESRRNPNKVMFLTYEELQADCLGCVKRLGIFLGCSPHLVQENAEGVVEKCSFGSLSKLDVNRTGRVWENKIGISNAHFFREGKVGEWKKYFTPQMEKRIYREIEQKLNEEGIHFTY